MALLAIAQDAFDSFQYLATKYRDIPVLLLLPAALAATSLAARRLSVASRWLERLATVLAAGVVATMLWVSASYLDANGYHDHVEASIAMVSWWYRSGHPLYPDWADGPSLYGWQYGPLLFQITAAALSPGPAIVLSKLPGFAAFWLSGFAFFTAVRPLLPSRQQALWSTAIVLMMAGGFFRAAYHVRADPLLLLLATLGLLAWRRLPPVAASIAIGLLAGGLMNLKIHGVLYVAPYAAALLVATPGKRVGIAAGVIGGGLVTLGLPFLDANVSFMHYAASLRLALHHGIDPSLLKLNGRFALVLMSPAIVLIIQFFRGQTPTGLTLPVATLPAIAVTALIGSKFGAGPPHLIPLLPLFGFLLAQAMLTIRLPGGPAIRDAWLAIAFSAIFVAYLPSFVVNQIRVTNFLQAEDDPAYKWEAAGLYGAYPGAVMGAAGNDSYGLTEYKVLGVFGGGKLVFDASTWMDIQGAGLPDDLSLRLLENCKVPFWIIPSTGAPFSMIAAYNPDTLFSDRFRAAFAQSYQVVYTGMAYTVWGCRSR